MSSSILPLFHPLTHYPITDHWLELHPCSILCSIRPINHPCTTSSPILAFLSINQLPTHYIFILPSSHSLANHCPLTTSSSIVPSFHPSANHSFPTFICSFISPPLIHTQSSLITPSSQLSVKINHSLTIPSHILPSSHPWARHWPFTHIFILTYTIPFISQSLTHSLTILSSIIPSSHPSANYTHLH